MPANLSAEAPEIAGLANGFADVGGVRLHYWRGGDPDGPPVFLWHGFLATAYAWREVAPQLAAQGFDVIAPDMRGYGDSNKPEGVAGYDARALAEEARALARSIGFGRGRPIIHVGHDMGAHPALLWTADHPEEVAGLIYAEAPVMLGDVLRQVFSYTPEAMAQGSMWWWILPLAPGVPERLVVGHEREFLTWFYGRSTYRPQAFPPELVDEYLRTFSGREGVLGAMGVYRAAFETIAQTEPLAQRPIKTPVVALGGVKGLGARVGPMVSRIAERVEAHTLEHCGHFIPEECPEAIVQHVIALASTDSSAVSRTRTRR